MTQFQDFDKALKARGWRYDVGYEEFRAGTKRLKWQDVVKLVAGFTLDELASYEDQKYDELRARRVRHAQNAS